MATILQAYTGASDAEAIEALIMDRRWQLVLDCIDNENAPFSQATLVRFRSALIIQGFDRSGDTPTLPDPFATISAGLTTSIPVLDSKSKFNLNRW